MKKSKFLKPFSFAFLALLIGAAGVFAFAPLGANPNLANASEAIETTTQQGLITTKADDPVIYTTESGLDIKWGNAVPSTYNQSLSSGNLKGFPYFTTTSGSTTYTWVIIGRNSNVSAFSYGNMASFLFSTWKTNSTQTYQLDSKSVYFFKNIYESTTPAGTAINGVVPSKSYVMDGSPLVATTEIPSGCVLVLSNTLITSLTYYSNESSCVWFWDCFSNKKTSGGTSSNIMYKKCQEYTSTDSFGFGTNFSNLQTPTLKQRCYSTNESGETSTAELKFFPLGGSNYTSENFKWESYLTAAQYKASSNVWCRGMYNKSNSYYTNTSGDITYMSVGSTAYLRPACVLKI